MALGETTFEIGADTRQLIRRLERELGREELGRRVLGHFGKRAPVIAGRISRWMLSGESGLKRRTGSLARSVTGRAEVVRTAPAMRIGIMSGPALRYAGVQEFGTRGKEPGSPYPTIRPRNAKLLTIPMGPALTAAGVERFAHPLRSAEPDTFRFIPFRNRGPVVGGLFIKAGAPTTAGKFVKRSAGKLAYLLMTRVDLKGKHYLRDGFRDALPGVTDDLTEFLRRQLASPEARG